jgi:CDGSH-type Zn-finger protein
VSCPSGAIVAERLDGGPNEAAPIVNLARVRENGAIALRGELEIEGQAPRFRATLCRCGASKQKPFCDGSHTAAGFQATERAKEFAWIARSPGALDPRSGARRWCVESTRIVPRASTSASIGFSVLCSAASFVT